MTTTKNIDDLISAIALATDAAQDAEDYDQPGRASKIRVQIRAMETELASLRAAEAAAPVEAQPVAPVTRPVTVAIDTACNHAGVPLIWGVAEGDDDHAAGAAIEDAVQWLAGGDTVRQSHRRDAMALDVVMIQWAVGEAIPDGQNARAIALAQAALAV